LRADGDDAVAKVAPFRPVEQRRPALPYRLRPRGNPAYVRFGRFEPGTVEVFVGLRALGMMREIAVSAWPDEAYGLLGGRACRDSDGMFTVVEAVEAARTGESKATGGSVHLSAAGLAALQQRLAYGYPALDPTGWFHSHTNSSAVFSGEDRHEQATWPDPHSVGIVAGRAPDRIGTTFGVYAGPEASLLTRIGDLAPAADLRARPIVMPMHNRVRPAREPLRGPRRPRAPRVRLIGVALLLAIVALTLLFLRLALRAPGSRPDQPGHPNSPAAAHGEPSVGIVPPSEFTLRFGVGRTPIEPGRRSR